ncbi:hypothetical protein AGLY_017424 [Aphis glycines]|uniref:DDE Tnp4 domain-containing protein n=1 Tax=Aphis glycines TaxID=307491 RepID=A0A6G0SW34_APHGL|nr:hypothetical protein AGLY_017424 [Aphis glycines]
MGCKKESTSAQAYFFVEFAPLPLVGTNFVALQYEFLLGRSTIGNIVRETCQSLWNTLQPEEMSEPNPDQWLEIANKFYLKTNFPNCVGAVDGKHIRCIKPINSGTMFFNYKKYFSIVLMAVVDAEYSFISIDVGSYGKESDSTIFKNCPFGKKLYAGLLNLPAPVVLPNTDNFPQPFVVIGDEAFGLHKNLLRPYPGRGLTQKRKIFNYRLSRARRYLLREKEEDDQLLMNTKNKKRKPISNLFSTRKSEGFFEKLIKGHFATDNIKFREFFRLNRRHFDFVLSSIKNQIQKTPTMRWHEPITPEEKLAVTLSYISIIVKETLTVLKQNLMPIFLPDPTMVDFKTKADEFWTKWNFPNCILAIDGKFVRIRCPNNSGSLFFNHKDYFSTVLLAMVDANYKFVAIDVGSYGKEGDSEDCALPGTDIIVPHVILGDQAFRLHKHILRPFSQKAARGDNSKTIFNYRLSRARRVTENAFGLLNQVFRVFY